MISVIVPTVAGRERFLDEKCLASYAAHTTDYELIVIPDKATCGEAWLEGAKLAQGDFIHFSADDLQPHAGWWKSAVWFADKGWLPAPRILNSDGSLQTCGGNDQWNNPHENHEGFQVDFPRIPFMTREQWDKIRPLVEPFLRDAHYWTDNAIGLAAWYAVHRVAVCRSYLFTHHLAQEKRGAGMAEPDRMSHDYAAFREWCSDLERLPAFHELKIA